MDRKEQLKYIILDFGKVLAYPTTGDWFITPKFLELISTEYVNIDALKLAFKDNQELLDLKIATLKEEYEMFTEFYYNALSLVNYPYLNLNDCKEIAHNRTYETDKYKPYIGIKKELKELSEKYRVLMLSDNWPDCIKHLEEYEIIDYFDKLYISSIYGQLKQDGYFFDNPIEDYSIKNNEGLFIDDNESLLDVARTRNLDVRLMDRENEINDSKYDIIHNLSLHI